jgi:hypothetical protein
MSEAATSDEAGSAAAGAAGAERALVRMREMSADLRGCAILDSGGTVLAATGDPERWGEAASAFLAAADSARDEPVVRAHVATEDGEAFALREAPLVIVAVADRFTLASLMLFDMRAVLRELVDLPTTPRAK